MFLVLLRSGAKVVYDTMRLGLALWSHYIFRWYWKFVTGVCVGILGYLIAAWLSPTKPTIGSVNGRTSSQIDHHKHLLSHGWCRSHRPRRKFLIWAWNQLFPPIAIPFSLWVINLWRTHHWSWAYYINKDMSLVPAEKKRSVCDHSEFVDRSIPVQNTARWSSNKLTSACGSLTTTKFSKCLTSYPRRVQFYYEAGLPQPSPWRCWPQRTLLQPGADYNNFTQPCSTMLIAHAESGWFKIHCCYSAINQLIDCWSGLVCWSW